MAADPVTFLATIPLLQSAIQVSGDGGARLKLDIDDTQIDAVVALMAMRGELLMVTIELESACHDNDRIQVDAPAGESRSGAGAGRHSKRGGE